MSIGVTVRRSVAACSLALATAALGATAQADVIYATGDPFGGWFGVLGFDISEHQAIGVRVEPVGEHTLDQISLWLWHNGPTSTSFPNVTVTLRAGDGGARPTNDILETWIIDVSSAGTFNPQLFTVQSSVRPVLESGADYWIVAEAPDAPGGNNPVWAVAQPGYGFMSIGDGQGRWQRGEYGGVTAFIMEGTPTYREFQLDVSEPVVAGTDTTFTVADAHPNRRTWLSYSRMGDGFWPVPELGVTLDILNPRVAGPSVMTDANGGVRWTLFTPHGTQGETFWIQAAQLDAESNVVMRTVQ
ncbi:MAG: choice-of-anchor R domain-containing protein [Phycisphaerales bacterium]